MRAMTTRLGLTSLAMALTFTVLSATGAVIEKVIVKSTSGDDVPENLVRANMACTPGRTYAPELRSEDIKRIYATGKFDNVSIQLEEIAGDKVILTVVVTPKPRVRKVVFEGNRKFKDRRLRALVEHKEGAILDETQVAADIAAVRKRYRDSGFHKATVTPVVQRIPNTNSVNVVIRIEEERRLKLKAVKFSGNAAFTSRRLRRELLTKRAWWRYIFRFGNYFDEYATKVDEDTLRELYTGKGYLDFRVTSVEQQANAKGTWVTVTFALSEGKPYTVKSVAIAGNKRFAEDELRPDVHLAPGAGYDSTVEKEDIERVSAKYEALGYIDLQCYPVHRRDSRALTVDVTYRINEGLPAHIRDVHILGNEVTKDHVIRRELAIHPGDLADARKIRASRSRLFSMNYFSAVDITPVATEKDDERDLQVKVEDQETGQVGLGVEFSGDEGALGFVELAQANFDWRDRQTFFRGGGQRLRLRAQVGTERHDFLVSFTEPWWLQRRLALNLDVYSSTRYEEEYTQQSLGFAASVTRPWRTFWRQSTGIRLQRIKLRDFEDDVSAILLAEEGSYNATRLTFAVSRNTQDRFLHPTRGSKLSLDAEVLSEIIGTYTNALRLNLGARKYFPVLPRTVLKLRADLGYVDRLSGDDVAIFDRYFAGGALSIRGFERREISPIDDAAHEEPIGGSSLLVASVEVIYQIFTHFRVSVFTDVGNVWEGTYELDPGDLNASVGVGFQVDVPTGATPIPLRLDYGFPVATRQEHISDKGQHHFRIGYSF